MSEGINQLQEAAGRLRRRAERANDKTIDMVMVEGVWLRGTAHYLTITERELTTLADWLEHIYYLELDGESEGTSFGELGAALLMAKAVNGAKESDS